MLRAELSRKAPTPSMSEMPASPMSEMPASPMSEMPPSLSEMPSPIASFGAANTGAAAEAKPARRTLTSKGAAGSATGDAEAPVKTTRSRTAKAATPKSTTTRTRKAAPTADGEEAPKKATRTRKPAAAEPAVETAPEATEG
jgi:hypothetical protein